MGSDSRWIRSTGWRPRHFRAVSDRGRLSDKSRYRGARIPAPGSYAPITARSLVQAQTCSWRTGRCRPYASQADAQAEDGLAPHRSRLIGEMQHNSCQNQPQAVRIGPACGYRGRACSLPQFRQWPQRLAASIWDLRLKCRMTFSSFSLSGGANGPPLVLVAGDVFIED